MTDIPQEAVELATAAVDKQKRVDRLLRQQSKAEWFARVALEAAVPHLTAAAEARGRKQAADAVMALADQWENHADSLCDRYAPDLIDTVQTYRHCAKALRSAYAAEQDTPGGGDER